MHARRDGTRHVPAEWTFLSGRKYADPFNEVELDAVFTGGGGTWRVPAFWAGSNRWRVRFAPPAPGTYRFRTECSVSSDRGLHGREGVLEAAGYEGDNPLLKHGPVEIAPDRRHFEHADGTPFFWLGDTWWMGLTKRLRWPVDVRRLAADRAAKGFTVVQIVAGLYPDMDWHDPRGANEAGFPYDKEFTRVNPAYFDKADRRIQHLVDSGLMPCIVACWGYFLPWMGVPKLKRHWRYLIARWGAHPVAWCLAGEAKMPYYLSTNEDREREQQLEGWTEIARYVRATDPMHRPITIHPTDRGREQVKDASLLDFEMLQTGHGGYDSIPPSMATVIGQCASAPAMPVLIGELNYEGFLHGNYDEVQRMAFWGSVLSGAAGFTYGANGIWQANTRRRPYGPSPHGNTWGNRPWDEAMHLPGASQLGLARRLLQRYRWWAFDPHPEWVEPAAGKENRWLPYAAGIPREVRVIYTYHIVWRRSVRVKGIEPDVRYSACFIDPSSGKEHALGPVKPEPDGSWLVPQQPEMRDWLLVLTTDCSRRRPAE
jgi:hypothetical protein